MEPATKRPKTVECGSSGSAEQASKEDDADIKVLLTYELDRVKMKLENETARTAKLKKLLEQSEKDSKAKIEEIEKKNAEEATSMNFQIKYLQVIRDRERKNNEMLTEQKHFWMKKTTERAKECDLLEEKVMKLEQELKTAEKKVGEMEEETKRTRGCVGELVKFFGPSSDSFVVTLERRSESAKLEPTCQLPICEICKFYFDETPARTPRMLGCGHTVCEECAENLASPPLVVFSSVQIAIKCPFDRKDMVVEGSVKNLPKNFSILDCVADTSLNCDSSLSMEPLCERSIRVTETTDSESVKTAFRRKEQEVGRLKIRLACGSAQDRRSEEFDESKVLYHYSRKDLTNVQKQLEKETAHVETLLNLLDLSERESQKEIEEVEMKNMKEMTYLNNQIRYLTVIKDRKTEKCEELERKVDYWKEKADERADFCEGYEREVMRLRAELEAEKKKVRELEKEKKQEELQKRAADEEMKKMLGRFTQECSRISKSTKDHMESVNSYLSGLEEMRRDEVRDQQKVVEIVRDMEEYVKNISGHACKLKEMRNEMQTAQQDPICQLPICQICKFHFDDTPTRTPRMLACGHTICEECAGQLAVLYPPKILSWHEKFYIRCPFDRRKVFKYGTNKKDLPKNFTVLECINGVI